MRFTSSRSAMSIVEFVGCFSALTAGVVLGSMYLGVDVKQMSLAVLKQAQLIDVPATKEANDPHDAQQKGAPPAPSMANGEADKSKPACENSERPKATAADSIPKGQGAAGKVAEQPAKSSSRAPLAGLIDAEDLIALTDDQRRTLTKAFWEALDQCMNDEVKNRTASLREDGNWQLFDYLTCRKEGHERAVSFIEQLKLRGVDPHVAAYAKTALTWHREGVKLFSRALDLLTDAPTAQLSGPFAQSWQSAATQHQMEERLVREKHKAVESYLSHALATAEKEEAPGAVVTAGQ